MKLLRKAACSLVALALAAGPAGAWTRPGHMVTAAIAYDEIEKRRPDLIDTIGAILDAHPDRGAFQVAVDRTTGRERQRRMFLECARWPDDARQTAYDHPSWHITLWGVAEPDAPPAAQARLKARAGRQTGEALEGLALNYRVLGDPSASAAEKATALCWLLHATGDIHQPFHTTELFSAAYPDGDAGAGRQFLIDPLPPHQPIALHWLWDDSISRSGLPADADARAREIKALHPRAALEELKAPTVPANAEPDFKAWARDESHALARSFALPARSPTSPTTAGATPASDGYWTKVRTVAERRVAIAGYRMADLVIAAMDAPK
uniref:S1/P1 nuclease n=1 Tax=uncultured Caulobacter sp. TaxID=158749 RepID=UPI0025FF2865|nr:S1/P1 nuclease [uncultured Caulobacter sp.]